MYTLLLMNADLIVESEDNGITVDTIEKYLNELIKSNLVNEYNKKYTITLFLKHAIDSKKNTVENTVNALYEVYKDFNKDSYIKLINISRKLMKEPISKEERDFLREVEIENPFVLLFCKSLLLNIITVSKSFEVSEVRDLSQKIKGLISECNNINEKSIWGNFYIYLA